MKHDAAASCIFTPRKNLSLSRWPTAGDPLEKEIDDVPAPQGTCFFCSILPTISPDILGGATNETFAFAPKLIDFQ